MKNVVFALAALILGFAFAPEASANYAGAAASVSKSVTAPLEQVRHRRYDRRHFYRPHRRYYRHPFYRRHVHRRHVYGCGHRRAWRYGRRAHRCL